MLRSVPTLFTKQAGLMVFSNQGPPPSLVDLTPRIASRPALLIWAPNGGNAETMNPTYQRLIGSSAEIWEIYDGCTSRASSSTPRSTSAASLASSIERFSVLRRPKYCRRIDGYPVLARAVPTTRPRYFNASRRCIFRPRYELQARRSPISEPECAFETLTRWQKPAKGLWKIPRARSRDSA